MGREYSCAATSSELTLCWGMFSGFGPHTRADDDPQKPRPQFELTGAVQISASENFGCGLVDKGEVQCWGYDFAGRLGHTKGHRERERVEQLSGAVQIAVGGAHGCALLRGGEMVCWGQSRSGQLGRTIAPDNQGDHRALPVEGVRRIVEIAAGELVSCARTRDQRLYCWGDKPWSGDAGDVRKPEARRIR